MSIFDKITSIPTEIRETFQAKRRLSNLMDGMSRQKATKIVDKLVRKYDGLKENDVRSWRTAHALALNPENPNRAELYNVYRDALLDDHLISVIQVRLEKLLKNDFEIVDIATGEVDNEATELLKKRWFWQFLTFGWNANLFGYTLIQFGDLIETPEGFRFKDVEEVDRRFLKPEFGVYVKDPNDEVDSGFSYRKGSVSKWLIEVGSPTDLGLLLEATPLTISKKYMGIFWDEFAEMFAAPMRVGKVDSNNPGERTKMANMLANMGRNAWAMIDQSSEIEIVETNKKDAFQVYDKRIERAEKGMSKRVLGSTMIVDDGSSHSQAGVHAEVTDDIVSADKRELMFTINEDLIPFLISHGYPLEGKKFKWDDQERLSLKDQAEIDKWLVDIFDIEAEYFKTKYNSSIIDYKKKEEDKPNTDPEGK